VIKALNMDESHQGAMMHCHTPREPYLMWNQISNKRIRILNMITGRNLDLGFTTSWINQR